MVDAAAVATLVDAAAVATLVDAAAVAPGGLAGGLAPVFAFLGPGAFFLGCVPPFLLPLQHAGLALRAACHFEGGRKIATETRHLDGELHTTLEMSKRRVYKTYTKRI